MVCSHAVLLVTVGICVLVIIMAAFMLIREMAYRDFIKWRNNRPGAHRGS